MAAVLREVEHSDLDDILALFIEVYGRQASIDFKKAFLDHSSFLGYCLIDESLKQEPMVGYFGCFTYEREIQGIALKFYNTHSWIVKEEYRKNSMQLLFPYLSIKDGILTNFSANEKVARILETFKFSKVKVKNHVLDTPFKLSLITKQKQLNVLPLKREVVKLHQFSNTLCLNLNFPNSNDDLELILKPIYKKADWVQTINKRIAKVIRKPLITKKYHLYKIHYCSNELALSQYIDLIYHFLLKNHQVGGLIIPDALVPDLDKSWIKETYEEDVFVKYNSIEWHRLDYLFSEVFYLNIADK